MDSFEQALVALDAASLSALARDHTASQWSLALRMGEKISLGRYEEAVEAHEELATRLRSLATHSRTSSSIFSTSPFTPLCMLITHHYNIDILVDNGACWTKISAVLTSMILTPCALSSSLKPTPRALAIYKFISYITYGRFRPVRGRGGACGGLHRHRRVRRRSSAPPARHHAPRCRSFEYFCSIELDRTENHAFCRL